MKLDPRRARGRNAPSIPNSIVPQLRGRLTEEEREEILGRLTEEEEESDGEEKPPLLLHKESEESKSKSE